MRSHQNCRTATTILSALLCVSWVVGSNAQPLEITQPSYNLGSQDSDSTETVEKKSPKGAMLRTLVIPGWGQWYNEQYIKAGLVLSVRTFLIGLAIHYQNQVNQSTLEADRDFYITKRNDAIVFYGIATILSMIDAYIDAHLYDFDVGPDLEIGLGELSRRSQMSGIGLTLRKRF